MEKGEFIKRYGEAAHEKKLQQDRDYARAHREEGNAQSRAWRAQHREEANAKSVIWQAEHREECNARNRKWCKANHDKVKARNQEISHKGGKYYEYMLEYNRTGLPAERRRIREKHNAQYRVLKQLIAPDSIFHHEWIPGTAKYRGVALVEKEAHQNGIIKVILVLEGEITLFTEKEIKVQK